MAYRTLQDADDLFERHLVKTIGEKGFAVVHQPEFAYTVGLWQSQSRPELIVFGLPAQRSQAILELAAQGTPPENLADGYARKTVNVDPDYYRDYFPYARWYYRGPKFEALQLVWPNSDHEFIFHPLQPQLSA
jgi:hypothetical protein